MNSSYWASAVDITSALAMMQCIRQKPHLCSDLEVGLVKKDIEHSLESLPRLPTTQEFLGTEDRINAMMVELQMLEMAFERAVRTSEFMPELWQEYDQRYEIFIEAASPIFSKALAATEFSRRSLE